MATKMNKISATTAPKNVFVLDDGTKEITLVNPFGKVICKLHIRTGDIGIYDRYKALMENFDSVVKPLSEVDITASGEAALDEMWELVKKVEDNLKQRINELWADTAEEPDEDSDEEEHL